MRMYGSIELVDGRWLNFSSAGRSRATHLVAEFTLEFVAGRRC